MPTNILMPALSPTMEKGNLAKWLKKEGDSIKSGDVIAEIETDKATMEVEAVDEGRLAKILVPEGTADVAVNAVIGVIAAEGEDASAAAPKGDVPKADAKTAAPQGLAEQKQPANEPAAAKATEPKPGGGGHNGSRLFVSPLARRMAKDGMLDLSGIAGSGPHGRIVERDVKAALAAGPKPAAAAAPAATAPAAAPPASKPVAASDETIRTMFAAGSFEEVPHDGMRKTIARRLSEAKQTIPHFYLSADIDLDGLLALREQINAAAARDKDGKPAFKVSVNDFVIKGLALALMRVPEANVTWTDGSMLKHKHADIGVAVSIPGGLITPIIRAADTKTLSVISNEMKDYAARARARKLKPEEYQGGTSAVSNLGMFGVKSFSAIVNPPHASILAVGAGEKRVVVKNNAPAVATIMTCTLSTDHRAVDGALGAELMAAFRTLIENPMGMLV
jgi:pyruvate dehydrogenase E2 component (dihydrolipoamide acetyltransferase)